MPNFVRPLLSKCLTFEQYLGTQPLSKFGKFRQHLLLLLFFFRTNAFEIELRKDQDYFAEVLTTEKCVFFRYFFVFHLTKYSVTYTHSDRCTKCVRKNAYSRVTGGCHLGTSLCRVHSAVTPTSRPLWATDLKISTQPSRRPVARSMQSLSNKRRTFQM